MAESNVVYKLDQVAIRMVKEPPLYSTDPMDSPEAAARLLSDFLRDYDREVFCVVALDARLRPININIASMGTLNASLVHPREVFKAAILSNASSLLLAHNHPSGDLTPSREDIQTTDQLVQLGNLLQIPVHDHIIVGDRNAYYSFKEQSMMEIKRHPYAERPEDISFSGTVAEPSAAYASGKTYNRAEAVKKRSDAIAAITEKLENGVRALFESDAYKAYLRTMAKFHHYSLNNTILIAMQKPEATLVAGYQAWQKNHGRHVKKGEKGIQILAPAPYKTKIEQDVIDKNTHQRVLDAQGNPVKETVEVERAAFRVTTVFDVSQTEGKELPSIGVDELSGNVEQYGQFRQVLIETSPVPIVFEEVKGGAKGFYSPASNDIHVQTGMSEVQTLKTMIHEIAHAMLHSPEYAKTHPEDEKKDRHTKEVEAESIAYSVCQHYGIDTSDYSFAYVAGWSSGKETPELKSSLQTIRDTADTLISEIDGRMEEQHRNIEAEKQKETESLAADLVDFYHDVDPFDYGDYSNGYEADVGEVRQILTGAPGSMLKSLQEIRYGLRENDSPETRELYAAAGVLMGRVEKLAGTEEKRSEQDVRTPGLKTLAMLKEQKKADIPVKHSLPVRKEAVR